MRRRRQLSSRILASVVAILLASSLVGFALVTLRQRAEFEHDYQQRALAVAQTFATMPSIREALARRSPADRRLIQSLAQQVRSATGATLRRGDRSQRYPLLASQPRADRPARSRSR